MADGGWAPTGALGGKWFAGESNDFHGPDHSPRVLAIDSFVGGRIALGQFAQQLSDGRSFQFRTQRGIAGRGFSQPFEESFEIKSRPPAEDRYPVASLDFGHSLAGKSRELGRIKR